MEQYETDPCVFRLVREGIVVLMTTFHVNDVAVAGLREEVDEPIDVVNEDFTTNDPGELSFFAGYAFKQDLGLGRISIT